MPWKQGYTISDEVGLRDEEVRWPNGNRCCVVVTVDLSPVCGPEGISAADLATPAAMFGAHGGLDGLLDVLRRHDIRATFAVPALIARLYPERLRTLAAEGHEIAAHGLRHEDVSGLSRDDERQRLDQTTGIIAGVVGAPPVGWYSLPRRDDPFAGGTISPHTMDLLIDAGYQYMGNGMADDIPHYWVTDFASRRAMLTLPYYYHFDDTWFLLFPRKGTGLEHADDMCRNWRAELAAQYRRGRCFTMTLHPAAIGWAHRLQMLEDFIAHMRQLPGLWIATGAECARHWQATFPAATHLRLEESVWRDYPGSLS